MPWYDSRGARLHYRDEGDGPVVVLLHGVWMSSAFFRHQTSEGLGGARVIAPDFRGHGESEKPLDGHTVAGYAEDLGTLLDVLDLRDVTLVGWSMGAFVAWEHLRQDVAGGSPAWSSWTSPPPTSRGPAGTTASSPSSRCAS
jgi:pimeloyl-ACP methyl ester carboxylesterase